MNSSISTSVPEDCIYLKQHKKGMKGIFVYVLEFMLSLDKMQNISILMCKKFRTWGQSILKVIQAFHTECIVLYIWCSGPASNWVVHIGINIDYI